MPIYEYKCKDCGKVSEFLVGVTVDAPEIKCSFCESEKLDKVISKSFISTSGKIISSQGGKTCCGKTERCDTPPCSDGGVCRR
ncbi:MAG: zinc ribbon domain-containing protein [bacterium]